MLTMTDKQYFVLRLREKPPSRYVKIIKLLNK